jgi:hypothetical protein
MKVVKAYSSSVDAEVAKIALAAAGVQLLVPDEHVEAALKVLERS